MTFFEFAKITKSKKANFFDGIKIYFFQLEDVLYKFVDKVAKQSCLTKLFYKIA